MAPPIPRMLRRIRQKSCATRYFSQLSWSSLPLPGYRRAYDGIVGIAATAPLTATLSYFEPSMSDVAPLCVVVHTPLRCNVLDNGGWPALQNGSAILHGLGESSMRNSSENSEEDARQLLRRCVLFRSLATDQQDVIVSRARIRRFIAGQNIFQIWSAGNSMMAVLSGKIRISVPRAGRS
jgi:hypothetical protein